MKRNPKAPAAKPPPHELLKAKAAARLTRRLPGKAPTLTTEECLHKLHVHQLKLEMQNEQLRLAQISLEEARDRYLDLYEFAPVGYLTLSSAGQITDINFAGARLLGLERKDLLMRRFDQFVAPTDVERWQRLFIGLKKTDEQHVEELSLQRLDGTVFPAQMDCRHKGATAAGQPHAVRVVLIDLSASKLAFFDPLTNLPNRRLVVDRLHHALAAIPRTEKYCALLFIDLDKFKTLNDSLGHDIGDQLLLQVAQRLAHCVREGDTVARLGGDEFVVLLENLSACPEESANQARSVGEKIAAALNQPYQLAGHEYLGSASLGATLFDNPHENAEDLLKRADMAMYAAKAAGRNALRFFDPAMQAAVTARTTLEMELRQALAGHQLQCHFQPQMDDAGRIPAAEVLLRWQHPQRGLMSPAAFIRVAEDSGLLLTIGRWVLETACAQIKAWEASPAAQHLHLAVNVSARQFHQSDFVEQVRTALAQSSIAPTSLTLEFKERMVLADLEESVDKMAALKNLGVRLAIDDFGMGCSSLSQLTRLPLDQLKIDRSLVRGIAVARCDKAIVQTLIDVTKHLGMEAIAEGVETEDQHALLGQYGCHAFQGYLFGKAVPGDEFEQLLTRH